jgi:anti-sigma factor RsiW
MNQVSHLPLEDLIAVARGEPVAPPEARHLARCEGCAGEVRKWSAVAGGVRVRMGRSEPPGHVLRQVFVAIDDWPSQPVMRAEPPAGTARHGLRGRGYAWLAAGAAAVLLAAGGYGVSTILGPASGSHASAQADAALTATGCSSLKAVGGTLISASGPALTIRTVGGSSVTVTTSADTKVVREVAGTLSDITDGTQVTVFGSSSGGTIDAKSVALRNGAASSLGKLPASPAGRGGLSLQLGLASGTVADLARSGFTVNEPDGSRVLVTTSSATTVLTLATSSIGQLEVGKLTSAVGAPGPDGTLAATMVEQDALATAPAPPSLPQGLPSSLPGSGHGVGSAFPSAPARPSPGNLGSLFSGLGCSQDAIATTYLISLSS